MDLTPLLKPKPCVCERVCVGPQLRSFNPPSSAINPLFAINLNRSSDGVGDSGVVGVRVCRRSGASKGQGHESDGHSFVAGCGSPQKGRVRDSQTGPGLEEHGSDGAFVGTNLKSLYSL